MTSKTKILTTKTAKAKSSKPRLPNIFQGKALFSYFSRQFFVERNCLMTAYKIPENITRQVLSSFSVCPVYIFQKGLKTHLFLPKFQILSQCRMCNVSVNSKRNLPPPAIQGHLTKIFAWGIGICQLGQGI